MDVRALTSRLSRATDPFLARHPGITVLIYHRVGGGTDSQVDHAVADFERQLEHLAQHHQVLTLDAAVARLADPAADHTPAVVITFDDGTADFAEHAVPSLVKFGLPATLYIATSFIDEQIEFPWGAPPLTWQAVRDSVATGLVAIGSHTHTHRLLDRADAATAADELDRSIESIAAHLGAPPAHFAYPKAVPGSAAAEIEVRRRFTSAALARSRSNRFGHTDPHRLWRSPVQRRDGFDGFIVKASGGMRLEGELRALALRTRSTGD